jgi:hypothetical protein
MNYSEVISNVKIYDLEESIIASGYPMRTIAEMREVEDKDLRRGNKLVEATLSGNTAHHQFLTGIRVNFDMTFTNKGWVEAERYRFLEFVSSQSTMHRITKFDLDNQYIEYVDPRIIEIMKEKVAEYNDFIAFKEKAANMSEERQHYYKTLCDRKYLEILYSNPAGFKITARMTTNYRCLRNIYIQRRNHRLPEWRAFCQWIETLPYADIFLTNIGEDKEE